MKEYTAKTLEELLEIAAKEKGVEPSELVYYVLEEKTGFFGIGTSVRAEVYALSDVAAFAESYLRNFFEGLDIQVEIKTEYSKNNINVNVNADNNAIIIGRGGRSLDGLSQLLRHAVNAQFKRRFYVALDINNYKQDRYLKLKEMAKRIAKQVQRSKVDVALDPMPNDERRIMHKELTDYPNIKTQSEGSGRNRYLKIIYVASKE